MAVGGDRGTARPRVKVLVDMNLAPAWVETLSRAGFDSVHWSEVGDPRASDRDVMQWARTHGRVVLTHDLDFGALLAASGSKGPSVLQVRARDVSPARLGPIVCEALKQYSSHLERGVLVSLDETTLRARILPLREES